MKILWIFFFFFLGGGHHKIGRYLGFISMLFMVFSYKRSKYRVLFQIFLGCLKFLIFFGGDEG